MQREVKIFRQLGLGSVGESLLAFFVFVAATVTVHAQSSLQPYRLRTDLLLHTDKVWKSGLPVNISLADAQKETAYQFPIVRTEHPLLQW
ncbi:MAG: hypothetical protein IM582_01745, partial [Chitinophagaceae bacterium]|nr:hypothetical protein [Chitinophagaceae bacterium]